MDRQLEEPGKVASSKKVVRLPIFPKRKKLPASTRPAGKPLSLSFGIVKVKSPGDPVWGERFSTLKIPYDRL